MTVFVQEVRLEEGWCDMGLLSMGALGVAAPKIKEKLGKNAGFALGTVPGVMYKNRKDKKENALQEGQARVAPVKAAGMKKGGKVKKGYHKMPDGKIMKDSEHKKTAKSKTSSASKRADGICKKGKTRGRMC